MRIAIPVTRGVLSAHFGHCEQFFIAEVDAESKRILESRTVDAPEHQPGLLPKWLAAQGVQTVIAGGMGNRAQEMFAAEGISVIIGAATDPPEQVTAQFLNGTLKTGENICDH